MGDAPTMIPIRTGEPYPSQAYDTPRYERVEIARKVISAGNAICLRTRYRN